jgi:hypothetical protein
METYIMSKYASGTSNLVWRIYQQYWTYIHTDMETSSMVTLIRIMTFGRANDGNTFVFSTVMISPAEVWTLEYVWFRPLTVNVLHPSLRTGVTEYVTTQALCWVSANIKLWLLHNTGLVLILSTNQIANTSLKRSWIESLERSSLKYRKKSP